MPEAVIVDTLRTPIGRAFKGSLTQVRPDDMAAYVIDQLLARNEGVDPASVEDVIMGCGMTQGEQAYNIGRIAVLLSETLPDSVTGSTIARYCASSLNAIRIGADSIRAGTGDVYIAAGVESVSRAGPNSEATLPDTQNPKLQGTNGTHNAYISMGETAENVADRFNVTREAMDEYAARSQQLAVESRDSGFFDREIIGVETPDKGVVDKDDGPRAGTTVEKLAELKPVF
ncbi:MAG: acetyl-CoA C-acetyltransferase, partial [Thermoleophilaceae bacterium]|nr:acetyl-CoA C-acetyltransferase [Thermoleophilaceae bacterium]